MPNLIGTVPSVGLLVGLHITLPTDPRVSPFLARLPRSQRRRSRWPASLTRPHRYPPRDKSPSLPIPVPYTTAVPVAPYDLGVVAVGFEGYSGCYPRDQTEDILLLFSDIVEDISIGGTRSFIKCSVVQLFED